MKFFTGFCFFHMDRRKYTVDAVLRRPQINIDGVDAVPVSVLGCGMRSSLPALLFTVASCGSRAITAEISEIEATVTVPPADADRVMRAIARLLSREHRSGDANT